jgi:4-hydroxybenzoate polyprenyltransferase
MRSAGCIVNDFFDRKFDGKVTRTKERPLVTGNVSLLEAKIIFSLLVVTAFYLVLQFNKLTIFLSVVGLLLAIVYPLMKRFMSLPQFVLGVAFSWGVPMAFAAQLNYVPVYGWLLFAVAIFWPLAYDSIYALMDKEDDLKAGVKSSVILFKSKDIIMILIFDLFVLLGLFIVGKILSFTSIFYVALVGASFSIFYQINSIKTRQNQNYYKAFKNNHWMGLLIFVGIVLNYFP